jgi:hypothetical protein
MNYRNKIASLGSFVVATIVGCSSDNESRCAAYACLDAGQLTGTLSLDAHTTQIDVDFCFEQDCRDALIDLTSTDVGIPCGHWEGQSTVCLAPSSASGVFDVTATWDHGQASKPADGSTYELRLSDHQSNAVLLDQTLSAHYVAGPVDNCHDCWGARLTLAGAAGESDATPDASSQSPSAP